LSIDLKNKMFDNTLLKILDKEVVKEKLRKQAKIKGKVKEIRYSKNNNIILIIETLRDEEAVLVNRNRKDMFKLAEKLNANDEVYARGDRGVNIVFCDELKIINKANLTLDKFE